MTMESVPETAAAAKTLSRARRDGLLRPCGQEDSGHRWYPDPNEEACTCCEGVRGPSRAWPGCIRTHCASAVHCEHLAAEHPEAFARAVVEAVRRTERATRCAAMVPEIPTVALHILASAQGDLDAAAVRAAMAFAEWCSTHNVALSIGDILFTAAREGASVTAVKTAAAAVQKARPTSPPAYYAAVVRREMAGRARAAEMAGVV